MSVAAIVLPVLAPEIALAAAEALVRGLEAEQVPVHGLEAEQAPVRGRAAAAAIVHLEILVRVA
jgi:hypothetical protein